tara:strand:- start:3493 stop:3780 length:288 start_codon:yes stop_codon:yes gene_type:complete
MSTPVGEVVVENHGKENETRTSVVLVTDVVSNKQEYRLDVYNHAGSLQQRVGYITGLTSLQDGSVVNGDQLKNINADRKVAINEYMVKAGVETEE